MSWNNQQHHKIPTDQKLGRKLVFGLQNRPLSFAKMIRDDKGGLGKVRGKNDIIYEQTLWHDIIGHEARNNNQSTIFEQPHIPQFFSLGK